MDKYVGKRLDGRYEIKEVIGVGGMAYVYKAYDSIDDRTVAVKILRDEYLANEEFTRRFKNESKAIAILSHPNIVKVYDVSFGERLQYIVMEYIDGITLKEYIEHGFLFLSLTLCFFPFLCLQSDVPHFHGTCNTRLSPYARILQLRKREHIGCIFLLKVLQELDIT